MGLREATFITFLLGTTSLAAADTRPTIESSRTAKQAADPGKAAKPPAKPAPAAAQAEQPEPPAEAETQGAAGSGDQASATPYIAGPKLVQLGHGVEIDLPAGFLLLERNEAQQLLRKRGDAPDSTVAIVASEQGQWEVDIDYEDSGYIEDSDADDLDADDLLESFRKGTAEQNKKRAEMGVSALTIDGWSEKPRYDRVRHHLVWGIAGHSTNGKLINYFTQILGRNGHVAIDLLCAPENLETAKQQAAAIFAATRFKAGVRFEDHVSSDRSSGIGLRGLVLGGAGIAMASKLGFLAKLLLVFKKAILFVVLGVGAVFRRLFRRGSGASDGPAVASRARFAAPPVPPAPVEPPAPSAEPLASPAALVSSSDDPQSGGSPPG